MRTIVIESLKAYPLWQIEAALTASGRQLLKVASGEGVLDSIWHTHGMIEHFVPSALPAMRAARQQKGELDFTLVNKIHVPVAILSMLLLAGVVGFGVLRPQRARTATPDDPSDGGFLLFAITIVLAILGNAAVCGVFANPHDRYGARIVWLATLAVAILPWRLAAPDRSPVQGASGRPLHAK
jgi:hypothetical protein